MPIYTPPQMAVYADNLPGPYVGERWATFRTPQGKLLEQQVEAWGQIATPDASPDLVANQMYNNLPDHGRGYTYVGWRIKPRGQVTFRLHGNVTPAEWRTTQTVLAGLGRR